MKPWIVLWRNNNVPRNPGWKPLSQRFDTRSRDLKSQSLVVLSARFDLSTFSPTFIQFFRNYFLLYFSNAHPLFF